MQNISNQFFKSLLWQLSGLQGQTSGWNVLFFQVLWASKVTCLLVIALAEQHFFQLLILALAQRLIQMWLQSSLFRAVKHTVLLKKRKPFFEPFGDTEFKVFPARISHYWAEQVSVQYPRLLKHGCLLACQWPSSMANYWVQKKLCWGPHVHHYHSVLPISHRVIIISLKEENQVSQWVSNLGNHNY